MVVTGLATCGRDRARLLRYDIGQAVGGATGGAATGAAFAALSLMLSIVSESRSLVGLAVGVCLVLMFVLPQGRRWSHCLARKRQVPQRWARRGPHAAGFMYGAVLGTGFATRTPEPWPQLLGVASLLSTSWITIVNAWVIYGTVRALAPILARRGGSDSATITHYTSATRSYMRATGMLCAIAVAAFSISHATSLY